MTLEMDDSTQNPQGPKGSEAAAELIRAKITKLYTVEPNTKQEISKEESLTEKQRSKHQAYMHELNHSGRSLAEIQTAWHNYYVSLPDNEKHEVWQEFYATHEQMSRRATAERLVLPPAQSRMHSSPEPQATRSNSPVGMPTVGELKSQLLSKVQARSNNTNRTSHLHSVVFGLGMGGIVMLIMLFGFFNERFITPFMTPSKTLTSTPIISDPNQLNVGSEPKLIIPKINLEVPVVYDEPSIDESAVQRSLERGVLHYGTTPNPGEQGHGVVFGHSSNNILNSGKYKFAFVLLKRLEPGDTFYIQKDGKRYVYRVYDKQIVKPTDVSVLQNRAGKTATFSLITCDPPGTSLNRLVVTGEQISPDPSSNVASTAKQSQNQPAVLPSNAPSLWHRIISLLSN
jgi:sortase A